MNDASRVVRELLGDTLPLEMPRTSMTDAQRERLLADLVAAAEEMADELEAFEEGELLAFDKEGEIVVEETFRRDSTDGVHAYGFTALHNWRRLLDDARRAGLVL